MECIKDASFLTAYLSFADREREFSFISFDVGINTFLHTVLNKFDLFSFVGRYLEGLLFISEWRLKKFFTILSSIEWKLTTTKMPPFDRSFVAPINPEIS